MTGQVSTAINPVVGSMSSVIVPSNRPSSAVRNSDRGDLLAPLHRIPFFLLGFSRLTVMSRARFGGSDLAASRRCIDQGAGRR